MCGREGRCNMAVSINDMPDKLFLSDYGGNYSTYIDAVYSVFEKDFIRRKAYFGSWPLQMKGKYSVNAVLCA